MTVDIPESEILTICQKYAAANPDDIESAVQSAVRDVRRLKNFAALIDHVLTVAVRRMIHDVRCHQNRQIRKDNGGYGGPAKVKPGADTSEIAQSVFLYFINGITLGQIRGEDLEEIAAGESARAEGHEFNARLCRRLRSFVKDGQTVQQVVTESKLKRIFAELQKGTKHEAA